MPSYAKLRDVLDRRDVIRRGRDLFDVNVDRVLCVG